MKRQRQCIEAAFSAEIDTADPLRLGGDAPNCIRVIAETTRGKKREYYVCTTGRDAPAMLVSTKNEAPLTRSRPEEADQVTVHYAMDAPWPRANGLARGRRRRRTVR